MVSAGVHGTIWLRRLLANVFLNEGKKMEEHITYLGKQWGLSDVDKLKVLRRALDMIDESLSKQ